MTVIIKRYPNRKLYDTSRKQYITLGEIGDLIKWGEDIQVIDNVTGEDQTSMTLSQVILGEEKKRASMLSYMILASLIRSSGRSATKVQRGLSLSKESLYVFDLEIRRRFSWLVDHGKLNFAQAEGLLKLLLDAGQQGLMDDGSVNEGLGVATKSQLHELSRKVEDLLEEIDRLEAKA